MKVLIADDDPAARFAIKRLLRRDFLATVTEVENGIDALEALSSERYSFMLLDVQMPLMDGIETLQAIRANPELVGFPVVIMTIVKNEKQVRELVRLGISDYFAKPLKLGVVSARLAELAKSIGTQEYAPRLPAESMLSLDGHPPIMLVDGDGEFRQFFANLFSPQFAVTAAKSGAHALKLCLAMPPAAIFIGSDLGALGHELLVRKLRSLPQFNATRIVAVAPSNLLPTVQQAASYDAGMPRTFVPDVLRQNFERVIGIRGPLHQILALYPTLRLNLMSAIEQVFALVLALEVMAQNGDPAATTDEDAVCASVSLGLPRESLELTVRLSAPAAIAAQIASRLAAGDRAGTADEDPMTALGEITSIIAGRLHKGFSERGINATCSAPCSGSQPTHTDRGDRTDNCIELRFGAPGCDVVFDVTLTGRVWTEPPAADRADASQRTPPESAGPDANRANRRAQTTIRLRK